MKILGIVFLVLAALNLIVALITISSAATPQSIVMKFNAFLLLTIIGSILFYFGNKKQNK